MCAFFQFYSTSVLAYKNLSCLSYSGGFWYSHHVLLLVEGGSLHLKVRTNHDDEIVKTLGFGMN